MGAIAALALPARERRAAAICAQIASSVSACSPADQELAAVGAGGEPAQREDGSRAALRLLIAGVRALEGHAINEGRV